MGEQFFRQCIEKRPASGRYCSIHVNVQQYEQVGPLDKTYPSNDVQTTTNNGDIVLYRSDQIVLFYGSNSWAYTRLGKMDLSENEVINLLSNGDVSIRLTL